MDDNPDTENAKAAEPTNGDIMRVIQRQHREHVAQIDALREALIGGVVLLILFYVIRGRR